MANAWLERHVLSYAHQGGAKEAPSSTLYAIERAIGLGIDAVELDVHATADGVIVVSHDPTLDRTTNVSGEIADHSSTELALLDNAYSFVPGENAIPGRPAGDYPLRGRAPQDHRFGVATLGEVLASFPGVLLNLDIKRTAPEVVPYEAAVASVLVGAGRRDDVIVTSFYDRATEAFRECAPGIGTAPGLNEITAFVQAVRAGEQPDPRIGRHVALQPPAIFGGEPLVDGPLVSAAHDLGLAVHPWTVDDPLEMKRLVAAGVDGIMSDLPSVLVEVLAEIGASWKGSDIAGEDVGERS